MPRFEQSLREICSLADSKRITDRKNSMKNLKELYEIPDAVEELNKNSRNQKGINWTTIMYSVHNVLLHEADRSIHVDEKRSVASMSKSFRTKDNKDPVIKNNFSMIMLDTIKKANSSEVFINCDDLVSLVLQIFSTRTYIDYQKTYLTILIDQILVVKQYQIDMKYAHWKELLKLSISLYEDNHAHIDKSLILKAMCGIVQHGCAQSHLTLRLKKIFPFLVEVFNNGRSDPRNLSEVTFKLANAVCRALGPECRIALCEFGETVIRSAIDLNSSCAKYDWLLLIVSAHHPGSVPRDHDASYACNWEKWIDILRLIYCMVINDCKLEFTSSSFIQLACEVSLQLKDDCTCIDDEIDLGEGCYERPSKRRRTVIGIQGMIDTLTVTPLKESKLSLQILIALIYQHPECIKENNYLPLMEFLIDYLNTHRDDSIIDELWEFGRTMIQLESKLSSTLTESDEIKLMWEKIWGITLRSASTNKYTDQVYRLLQSLISHKKVIDSNAFLNLYLKDTVTWSKSSIHTLLIFCKNNIIQDFGPSTSDSNFAQNNYVSVKVRLLQWVLAVPKNEWTAQFPIESVCELLVGLTLKSWYNIEENLVGNTHQQPVIERLDSEFQTDGSSFNNKLLCEFTRIESTYLLTAFEGTLYEKACTKSSPHCKPVKDNILYIKENRDLLISDLIGKNTTISETEHVHLLMVQTTVIAKVFSNLKLLNIAPRNIDEAFRTIVKNTLEDISLSVEGIVQSKKKLKVNQLMNILEALYLFYKTSYDNDVADIIRSSTDPQMLMNILLLTDVGNLQKTNSELNKDDSNTTIAYIKNMEDLSDRHRLLKTNDEFQKTGSISDSNNIRMKASTILATFCGMVNGSVMSSTQENLQKALLNPNNYDLSQIFDFRMAVIVLELLVKCGVSSFSGIVVDSLLKLLQQLCRTWHKDEEAARMILNILSKLFIHLGTIGSDTQQKNSLRILHKFHELLQGDKYGPMVYIAFIQCLETLARIDPVFRWTKWKQDVSESADGIPVVQDLLVYIQSPFHIVRLKARNCLKIIFASKDVNLEWLTEFFVQLSTTITGLFVVKAELEERAKEDERTNRTATALHMMAIVISCSALFCCEALLFMFKITVEKNINFNIVKKVLDGVSASLNIKDSKYLVENNLNYLITHWLKDNNSLHKFPVVLAYCATEQEFYQKHINVIVPILIQNGNLKDTEDLCNKFGLLFKDVIESCFPRLISWMLPCISADPLKLPPGFSAIDIQRATDVFNQLKLNQNEFQTVKKISILLEDNLESVILTLIKRLHDKEHAMQFIPISVDYPSSDPPHFKQQDIERSFKYLEDKILETGTCLLELLATKKQHILQKVLSNLKCSIHTVNSIEPNLKALHHYVYFSMMIIENLDRDYCNEISTYVVRDICYTMVYFIKENTGSLSQAACSYFYYLLRSILPKKPSGIDKNLRLIVATMIPIVKGNQTEHAYDILKFLIAEKNNMLGRAIESLDSFPMDKVFQDVRQIQCNMKAIMGQEQNLEYEIQHFLNTRGENIDYCSSTELEHLREQLSTKKTELRELYQSLGLTHRFSEDCASSILHQLICVLVKLTASTDPDISLKAAKCLGEIGPADLSTMILQPEKTYLKQLSDPMLLFTYRVVVLLSKLLIHSDVELFTSTSEALYIIMASFWGQKICNKKNVIDITALIESSEELLEFEYIRPFVTTPSQSRDTIMIDKTEFSECISTHQELWIGKLQISHKDWLTKITCNILQSFSGSYLKNLIPVCKTNVPFCEKILPWIIHLVLHTDKRLNTKIYANINKFFDAHCSDRRELQRNSSLTSLQRNICFNHKSVQCMLNVVDFIRSQSSDNCQLELNYLHVAKAAQYCSAYFTSVLYAELWSEKYLRECPTIDNLTSIDYICEIEPENGRELQEILREACIKIGDLDGLYGCGTSLFQNPSAKVEHYVQLRKWDKVLLAHDIELSLGNKTVTKGLLDALQHSGLQYLLGAFVKSIEKGEEDIDNYRYECAWRLSDWNIPTTQQMIDLQQNNHVDFQNIVSNDYPLFHYHALRLFHERDTDGLKATLDNARVSIIKTLRNISLESCKTIYPALSQLQMLREIEEMFLAKPDTYKAIIEKLNNQDSIGLNDFEYIEPILSQRTILLEAKGIDDGSIIKNALIDTHLQVIELSKKQGYFQMAARALGSLAKQVQLSAEVTDLLQYEEALLAWMRGDQELGRHLLRNLIIKDSLGPSIHARALTAYGNWMAETKSENPQKVIQKYYLTALEYGKKIKNPTKNEVKSLLGTHAALAQFADTQYQQILAYMKSPQFESFKECVAYSEQTAAKLSASLKDNDEKKAAFLNRNQSTNDIAELENIEREKNMYLLLALKHYIVTLQQSENHNLLVFRLVSLWLDNTHHKELNELLQAHLNKLPSHKFVLLVPQLAPHMTDTDDVFSTQIYDLLKRCAVDHPHHTLPVLLSLMNLHKDHEFYKSKKKPTKVEPRVLGAKKLIEDLMTTNIKSIIVEMHRLSHSLIMLANLETKKNSPPQLPVPNQAQSIIHIKDFKHTLIPTLSIDINPNKEYNHIIGIHKYMSTFELVGGINAPKKITCIGTDGIKRNQLVKGKDDLRQDAVMQQVFTVMNMLLSTSKEAKKRKLNVRTYKVVPLTQRCGVLEWCDNTMPIYAILGGFNGHVGLHKKYYPNDYTTTQCRKLMEGVSKKSNKEKLERFMDCCKHLHPVFQYFFLENFSSPEIWFERRLAYVHSVATNSIIGYILGLGDRHLNNILIDKSTAEVIHIDFGIAFEQGKVLPTPETVPFRLTRDMEAAMGVSGVEGILRRSCEETMTVLRNHREVILTLLQVLLYDPLFSWAITPAKAYSFQKGKQHGSSEGREASGETNKLAERALLRLDQKLRGTEEGSASSIPGQVEKLIQEARDPANLCRIFCGWQPYL